MKKLARQQALGLSDASKREEGISERVSELAAELAKEQAARQVGRYLRPNLRAQDTERKIDLALFVIAPPDSCPVIAP